MIKKLMFVMMLLVSFNVSAWKGLQITDASQIDEVSPFSTAFAYAPKSANELKAVLDKNNGRMLPFIEISRYFWDYDTGTFIYKDPTELLNALGNHKIMIMLDEPFWWIRQACQNGKPQACSEIDSGYYNTREFFKNIKLSSGFQMMHVEAYAELNLQKASNPNSNVIMIESADHIAFSCYGDFNYCGGRTQMEYAVWLYETMKPHQKIFLVAGAFNFADEAVVIDQLNNYFFLFENYRSIVSGIGVFVWGNLEGGIVGARNIPTLKSKVEQLLLNAK